MTFLESRKVIEWMESLARERGTDLSVILREATSAYYVEHRDSSSPRKTLFEKRAATKAAQRRETARLLTEKKLSPAQAQKRNAPIEGAVKVVDLWASIRRHVHAK